MRRPFGYITAAMFNEAVRRAAATKYRRRPGHSRPSINYLLTIHGLKTFESISHLRAIVNRSNAYARN